MKKTGIIGGGILGLAAVFLFVVSVKIRFC